MRPRQGCSSDRSGLEHGHCPSAAGWQMIRTTHKLGDQSRSRNACRMNPNPRGIETGGCLSSYLPLILVVMGLWLNLCRAQATSCCRKRPARSASSEPWTTLKVGQGRILLSPLAVSVANSSCRDVGAFPTAAELPFDAPSPCGCWLPLRCLARDHDMSRRVARKFPGPCLSFRVASRIAFRCWGVRCRIVCPCHAGGDWPRVHQSAGVWYLSKQRGCRRREQGGVRVLVGGEPPSGESLGPR